MTYGQSSPFSLHQICKRVITTTSVRQHHAAFIVVHLNDVGGVYFKGKGPKSEFIESLQMSTVISSYLLTESAVDLSLMCTGRWVEARCRFDRNGWKYCCHDKACCCCIILMQCIVLYIVYYGSERLTKLILLMILCS